MRPEGTGRAEDAIAGEAAIIENRETMDAETRLGP